MGKEIKVERTWKKILREQGRERSGRLGATLIQSEMQVNVFENEFLHESSLAPDAWIHKFPLEDV